MNVFILGSGGRESALYHTIKKSQKYRQIYVIPGNAGTDTPLDLQNISLLDFRKILEKTLQYKIDAMLVGTEIPLAAGIKDFFIENLP